MNKVIGFPFSAVVKAMAKGLFISAAMVSTCAVAQVSNITDTQSAVVADNVAKDALKVSLQKISQFSSEFVQIVSDYEGNIVHEAQGIIAMSRPNKFRWETTFPDEALVIADGETVYSIDSFVEQVTLLDQSTTIADNPIVLLTSNDSDVWDKFDVTTIAGDSEAYYVLPQNQNGQIKGLTIAFSIEGDLSSIVMLDAQQQQSAISFNSENNRIVSPDLFSVEIPEHYIVDDQR
ncbi:outer membrane lipoprotein chaperone LolA [Alteromonas sp. KUL49]|uniref:outer membrane lipoprotein chaperone LolA n=1 Tax=Alteromonas sp. KUL49 TaxID=2480798 RepID=UPI00102F0AE4|nr:outer membrane lipoprotein chaperone LolA [Alteromonas sp. KUL49]TAP40754.1 outer membrane lipoprotein chaperone LolA [Alteromonas sp. KUL49]GEA10923.1 outer-membrane lipoprotein carrier protein [Alteromonas sp. KUL49]